MKNKENRGGKRIGSGRKQKFGEPTVRIFKRVPESKKDEIELKFDNILKRYVAK